jgi:hypothetical protein
LLLWFLLVFLIAAAFGVWRKFGAIQWIWLLAGFAIALLIVWFLVVLFFIGPEMVRTAP